MSDRFYSHNFNAAESVQYFSEENQTAMKFNKINDNILDNYEKILKKLPGEQCTERKYDSDDSTGPDVSWKKLDYDFDPSFDEWTQSSLMDEHELELLNPLGSQGLEVWESKAPSFGRYPTKSSNKTLGTLVTRMSSCSLSGVDAEKEEAEITFHDYTFSSDDESLQVSIDEESTQVSIDEESILSSSMEHNLQSQELKPEGMERFFFFGTKASYQTVPLVTRAISVSSTVDLTLDTQESSEAVKQEKATMKTQGPSNFTEESYLLLSQAKKEAFASIGMPKSRRRGSLRRFAKPIKIKRSVFL